MGERLALCEVLRFRKVSTPARPFRSGYAIVKNSFLEAYMTSPIFQGPYASKGPTSVKIRYVIEDVGVGLVFWSSIGDRFKILTPTMKSLIHLASVINQTDYMEKGKRTREKFGFVDISLEELHKYLQTSPRG